MNLAAIRRVLDRHPYLTLAIVFGSVAAGSARRDSDLDIAVQARARQPLTNEQKIRLIDELALATGRPVDLIDLATTGVPLLGEIIRHGKRILGNDEAYADLALRNIYLNEDFLPYAERSLKERNERWLN